MNQKVILRSYTVTNKLWQERKVTRGILEDAIRGEIRRGAAAVLAWPEGTDKGCFSADHDQIAEATDMQLCDAINRQFAKCTMY